MAYVIKELAAPGFILTNIIDRRNVAFNINGMIFDIYSEDEE